MYGWPGQVLLGGHDTKTLKPRWLRDQIGLVIQEPALFATTIKENILLGRANASQDEIEEASRVANAHSFIIKLPDGFDTRVCGKKKKLDFLIYGHGNRCKLNFHIDLIIFL